MRNLRSLGVLVVGLILATSVRADPPALSTDPAGIEFFETKIRPVLAETCYECHSAEADRPKGGLRLDSAEALLKGGATGPVIVPGDPDASLLIQAIRYLDKDLQMPPEDKLSDDTIAHLEQWVKLGAPFPSPADPSAAPAVVHDEEGGINIDASRSFWSFIPPAMPEVPQVEDAWAKSEIDRFIFAELAKHGLRPSPIADKRTLIRRATYDLIGLPPTAEEIDAFEADASPDAFEKVIDRLLASPHYGERWGRHWLDVARYADTKGYVFEEERRYAFSYTYRDWVIRAFNEDLPYDQFIIQQIAADKLDLGEDKRPLAALGFLTLGRRFLNNQHDIIDDRIDVVTRGTMGLTVSCARCHDHKYDPIPTADYYSLYGVFASTREPEELPLLGVEPDGAEAQEFFAKAAELRAEVTRYRNERRDAHIAAARQPENLAKYLLGSAQVIAGGDASAVATEQAVNLHMLNRFVAYLRKSAEKNDLIFAAWRAYAALPAENFEAAAAEVAGKLGEDVNPLVREAFATPAKSLEEVAQRYAALLAAHDKAEVIEDANAEALRQVLHGQNSPLAVNDNDVRNLLDGEEKRQLRERRKKLDELTATHAGSPPRAMAVEDLPAPQEPRIFRRGNPANQGDAVPRQFLAILSPPQRTPFSDGSGRLELAHAIVDRSNPLSARVMVNRVWLHHFGRGIVDTPSDFGTRGERPSHPQLLDYLAVRFMEDGWSIKKLHKLIMLSAVYQQQSADNAEARQVDPENRLLWRMNVRRLEFESLRDSLLAAAGTLDPRPGGRAVDIVSAPYAKRRTVYGFVDRQNLPGMFRTFDFASPDTHSPQRYATSVPQQALFMMNSPFVIEQARALASRPQVLAKDDPQQRIAQLYRVVLGRFPSADELRLAAEFVATEASAAEEARAAASDSPWQYGYAAFDLATQKMEAFTPLPHFAEGKWMGGAKLPDKELEWAMLSAAGGHPGTKHAVIRRWTAPRDCTIHISGTLAHAHGEGDGVRGRIIAAGEGELASWIVHNKSAGTDIRDINIKAGETIDFIVDCRGTVSHDGFNWSIALSTETPAPEGSGSAQVVQYEWKSAEQFAGPALDQLSPWEKLCQVLLQSNEFVFVD